MQEYLSIGVLFLINLLNYMDRFTIAGNTPNLFLFQLVILFRSTASNTDVFWSQ